MDGPLAHAYIAGMVDADGTIGIRRFRGSTHHVHYRPMVEVTNMSVEVMTLLNRTFGERKTYQKNSRTSTGQIYTWRATGSKCKSVIEAILPYLQYKKDQALNCLKLVNRIGKRGGVGWTAEKRLTEDAEREALYFRAKELNSPAYRVLKHAGIRG